MKIARYRYDNKETYGVLNNDSMLSLPALAKENKEPLPENIEGFIAFVDCIKLRYTLRL